MSTVNVTDSQNETSFNYNINIKNEPNGLNFFHALFWGFCAVTSIILLSTLIYYVMRKRALDDLRHRLVPLYHFDPAEREDWEDALLDESKKEKPRIIPQYYRSMSSPIMTTAH